MSAPEKLSWSLIIENVKAAARHYGRDVAATEAQGVVHSPDRIGEKAWVVAVRIDRINREKDWIIRRKWKCHDFEKSNPGPRQTAVETADEAGGICGFRRLPDPGLFHGALHFAEAGKLSDIPNSAPQFLFRPCAAGE